MKERKVASSELVITYYKLFLAGSAIARASPRASREPGDYRRPIFQSQAGERSTDAKVSQLVPVNPLLYELFGDELTHAPNVLTYCKVPVS